MSEKLKTYIGISRDHSASMRPIATAAARQYNTNIQSILTESEAADQDTIVSVVKCGVGVNGIVQRDIINSNVKTLKPIAEKSYDANGYSTPLFDSVGELIEMLSSVPDANDPNVSFMVMAVTDGLENSSHKWTGTKLAAKIRDLQATDHWTFVFKVPRGYGRQLMQMGVPEGNILEWDQSQRGVEVATQADSQAFKGFFTARSAGATSVKSFYQTNLTEVDEATIKASMVDISSQVQFWPVTAAEQIRTFCEDRLHHKMMKGAAFYQLTKTEREVQDYKVLVIRDKTTKHVYSGVAARDILGLPHYGTIKIKPGDHGNYDIFVQSTSVNRKLVPGTELLYWDGAR